MLTDEKTRISRPMHDAPLSPSTILDSLRVSHPSGIVTIEGMVVNMNPGKSNPNWMYGEMRDELGDGMIKFRCPIGSCPSRLSEIAVIRGSLFFSQSTKYGAAIRIHGDCISQRPGVVTFTHPIQSKAERSKVKLTDFIDQHGIESLLVIGTTIAIKDIKTALQEVLRKDSFLNTIEGEFNSPAKLLEAAKAKLSDNVKGVLYTRGGNDAYTLRHWDDPEFINQLSELDCRLYTAIGHANQSFLIEKYVCDDCFPTPTAAGHAIGKAIKAKAERLDLEQTLQSKNYLIRNNYSSIKDLESAQARLNAQLASLTQERDAALADAQRLRNNIKLGFGIAGALLLAWILI